MVSKQTLTKEQVVNLKIQELRQLRINLKKFKTELTIEQQKIVIDFRSRCIEELEGSLLAEYPYSEGVSLYGKLYKKGDIVLSIVNVENPELSYYMCPEDKTNISTNWELDVQDQIRRNTNNDVHKLMEVVSYYCDSPECRQSAKDILELEDHSTETILPIEQLESLRLFGSSTFDIIPIGTRIAKYPYKCGLCKDGHTYYESETVFVFMAEYFCVIDGSYIQTKQNTVTF